MPVTLRNVLSVSANAPRWPTGIQGSGEKSYVGEAPGKWPAEDTWAGAEPCGDRQRLGDHAKLSSLRLPWRKPAGHWHAPTVHPLCGTSTHGHVLHPDKSRKQFPPSTKRKEMAISPRVTHCQPQNAIRLASNPGHTLRNAGFGFSHQITDFFF